MALERDFQGSVALAEWKRSNWWTHPLFCSLVNKGSCLELRNAILSASDAIDRVWAVRASLFHIDSPGVRRMLFECFELGVMPEDPVLLWPHANLRSRFIQHEVLHATPWQTNTISHGNWLRALACCWPWLWKEDAQQQGMGEAHPIARIIKAGSRDVLPALYSVITPDQWLNWEGGGADKMVSAIIRKGSLEDIENLCSHDPSVLNWHHKKDGRGILHEACLKLRPDLVSFFLSMGRSPSQRTPGGYLPSHFALRAAIEDMRPKSVSRHKLDQAAEHLREVLHLLGNRGQIEDSGQSMLDRLDLEKLDRLRMIVEEAILRSNAPLGPHVSALPHRL